MMRLLFSALVLIGLACTVRGQGPKESDVPEAAHYETLRRGDHLETLGSTQAGPEAAVVASLAPPEDDSDRWWICVVTSKDVAWRKACGQLLVDFDTSINLRAWADIDNPALSWAHFQERDFDDPINKDWLAGIREQLAGQAFPAVVLQPPRNGSYGRNAVTVGIIHGYNGDAKQLSDRIRAKIKAYSDKVAADKLVLGPRSRPGHAQSSPPYMDRGPVRPVDTVLSRDPTEWPDIPPPKPKTMTYKQVRGLCPAAPVAWVREQVKAGIADEDELAEAYDEWVEGHHPSTPKDEAETETVNPTQPAVSSLWDMLIAVGIMGGVPLMMVLLWRRRAESMSESRSNGRSSTSNGIDESSTSSTRDGCVPFSRPSGPEAEA